MSIWQYIFKSLLHYKRNNVTVVLTAAVATAVLVGALVIGDSIRGSLLNIVNMRLQSVEYAMQTGDRYFTSKLGKKISDDLDIQTSAILQLEGMLVVSGSAKRANRVQIIGFDEHFFEMANLSVSAQHSQQGIFINKPLADHLNLSVQDRVLVRMNRPQIMPLGAPLAQDDYASTSAQFTVEKILSKAEFGLFNLENDQSSPLSVFIPIQRVLELAELDDAANVLLVEHGATLQLVENALNTHFSLADAALHVKAASTLQLVSDRVFLDPFIQTAISLPAQPVLTYLINDIVKDAESTPYSFVSGVDNHLRDDEIIINKWLADDLDAHINDIITLNYYVLGTGKTLIETQKQFRVHSIQSMSHSSFRAELMPAFPGLQEENCRDWESGFPIDYDKIRDKDEEYWDEYRGTPKAIIHYKTAEKIWGNRFGALTALEFNEINKDSLEKSLLNSLTPQQFGFVLEPVQQQAMTAASQYTDFSQLFLGLSFFVILAAVILTALLFVFYTDKRRSEIALLKTMGFRKNHIYKIIVGEGVLLAMFGSLLGIFIGLLYNQLLIFLLKTVWNDIIRTDHIQLYASWPSIAIGFVSGFVISIIALIITVRKLIAKEYQALRVRSMRIRKVRPALITALLSFAGVMAMLLTTHPGQDRHAVSIFFLAGFLLLTSGISLFYYFFSGVHQFRSRATIRSFGLQNIHRNLFKNMSIVTILALGVFLIFMVGSNKTNVVKNSDLRSSGTGGFRFFASTTVPVLKDLNDLSVQKEFALADMDSVDFVPFYVKSGDEASCLNLNQISQPQLVATSPGLLAERNAFTFTSLLDGVDPQNPWAFLNKKLPGGAIPAFADQTVITWSLMKQVGDTLFYIAENGNETPVVLAGGTAASIFQGNLVISKDFLLELYPSTSGYKMFFIDAPSVKSQDVAEKLGWALQDYGISIVPTIQRLAEFAQINNTYLSIFLILGGFGLLLGTIGIGLILMRTLLERQSELGVMQALGFNRNQLLQYVLAEYIPLLLVGVLLGAFSAIFAALPALSSPGAQFPLLTICIIFLLIICTGYFWIRQAALYNLKVNLINSIRQE